jgi:hypothetical protein
MASHSRLLRPTLALVLRNKTILLVVISMSFAVTESRAKEQVLTAIELYDGSKGAAYLQLTNVLVNGKTELRACAGPSQKIDRSAYAKLPKVDLAGATSLKRTSDGSMVLERGGTSQCVVPANLKLEKDEALTPGQLADRSDVQATILSASSTSTGSFLPPFKPGVELRFVAAPDVELAEYLRAERAATLAVWQDYLGHYATSGHANQAKQAAATLLIKGGEGSLAAYRKAAASASPTLTDLKDAKARADQALSLVPNSASALQLKNAVGSELAVLADKAQSDLDAYRQALASRGPGYVHLNNSRKMVQQILDVNPQFDRAQSLQNEISNDTRAVDSSLQTAESLLNEKRFDEALSAIEKYRSFADEEPRVATIVNAAYKYHFDKGGTLLGSQKWSEAVQELQKAESVNKTAEVSGALKKAQEQLGSSLARQAADAALAKSEQFAEQHQYVEAYEVLAELPSASKALVADRMESLESSYIKEASEKAKNLQMAHTPIRGRADEVGVLRAFDLLQSAYSLSTDNKQLKLRLDVLAENLSDYYLQQAKKYFQKPLGSGVGLGWLYLDQSQLFEANRADVRDERTKNSAAYQMRSKLSIRVVFRDQTSRRDSAGFADQMSDAIATGVETTGLPVRVVRANDTSGVDPNFQLVGDVLQHRPVLTSTVDAMESKYRVGAREIPNEEWNKANRDFEAANMELQRCQRVLEGAQSRGKKKEIADANLAVSDAEKKVQDAHRKMDSVPKTNPDDIIKPYTYTKRTIDLASVVEVAFRIVDASGDAIEPATSINKTNSKQVVVFENVKPEDTAGVKAQGSPPDEIQFLNDLEIEARDALIKTVVAKVQGLPQKILALARKQAQEGDLDGAAEKYILYLNATPEQATPARGEARKFLEEQFNIRPAGASTSSEARAN